MKLRELLDVPNPKQAIFDTVCEGLASQGFERSIGSMQTQGESVLVCRYRSNENHRKCAIGHLIPDDEYEERFEFSSTSDVLFELGVKRYTTFVAVNPTEESTNAHVFLSELQYAHDKGATPAGMRHRLKAFAYSYQLALPASVGIL